MKQPPTALLADGTGAPLPLPETMDALDGWVIAPEEVSGEADDVTLFLTIDTEDAYFTRPHLMTGEGIGAEHGVLGILDELDSRSLRGTFFVNVYESVRQPEGAVEAVVKGIAERGHEVGLHTHPSPALDFYQRPLFRLETDEQVKVIRWGADLLESWTGCATTSFRAGGYALNEDTYTALIEAGIQIDSSWFFPSPNNHVAQTTVNAVTEHRSIVEVPVSTVIRVGEDRLEQRKIDLDWLATGHLHAAIESIARNRGGFAVFMMHSFSFIEKATRMPEEEASPRALFTSEPLFNRYVEIYGPKPAMRRAFADFLDGVVAAGVRVSTLREALPELREAATRAGPDVVPVVVT